MFSTQKRVSPFPTSRGQLRLDTEEGGRFVLYIEERVSLLRVEEADSYTEESVSLFYMWRRQTPPLDRRESVSLLYI